MTRSHLPLLFVALAVALGVSGCGPKHPETFPVSGTVTLDGKPVEGAAVVFTPDEGAKATGTTDQAGNFQLSTFELYDGALPGQHRVTVAKTSVDPDNQGKIVFLVPKTYGNLQTTDLTCDVQKEMTPVSFALLSGSRQATRLQPEPTPIAGEEAPKAIAEAAASDTPPTEPPKEAVPQKLKDPYAP